MCDSEEDPFVYSVININAWVLLASVADVESWINHLDLLRFIY